MSEERIERITLAEKRDMMYEKFRTNVRILRAHKGISGSDCSKEIGLKDGKRLIALEYGRSNPTMEEMIAISKYFSVTIDDLLSKEAKIEFKDLTTPNPSK